MWLRGHAVTYRAGRLFAETIERRSSSQQRGRDRERERVRSLGTTKGKKITDRADIVNCMSRSFIRIHSRKEKYNLFAFVSVIRPKHFSFHFTRVNNSDFTVRLILRDRR